MTRRLGPDGPEIYPIGYGAMPLNWEYGTPVDLKMATEVIDTVIDSGVDLVDTADAYGPNEELVGTALAPRRTEVKLASKVGLVVRQVDPLRYDNDGRPDHIRSSCEESLRRLRTEWLDLYQLHRVDPEVPVEESVGAMADLVADGKVRAIGLSEVDVDTLERARAVYPISSVQSELSLWTRDALKEVVPYCERHRITFLPYSPLGRGFLTGRLSREEISDQDFRSQLPRFEAEAMEVNATINQGIAAVAERHEATNAQVALAWLLAQSDVIVPIPGTKTPRYARENAAAADLELTDQDISELDDLPEAQGGRY